MAETADLPDLELRLPGDEAALLREEYSRARSILEYGCGGSTAIAGAVEGASVFSVESDEAWIERIEDWFAAHPPAAEVHLHHADIGPVTKWGRPANMRTARRFPGYALSVWDRPDFVQPDVVLVDGRFRAACLLATLFRTQRGCTLLFDDYVGRPHYHGVERFVRPERIVGRMARFEITPMSVPPEDLLWVITEFVRWQ
ncbi:hypothetical protein [Wenxinia saemankumensis]|uniref:Methyltransferase domain-containing protein n=1 Tax=Wenxinia saemankumensis TaxID=1447782 RepID=A0A1M6H3G2_9RHOB|nr:hypothetical protein [Wenxinia saemankumensis]SHJ16720.1 hypothetical protein SAMN05444417_3084 [Wenxinia saemankumensis]